MILNWKKADFKVYQLKCEGVEGLRSVGVVGVSLSSKLHVNVVLDICRKASLKYDVVIQVVNSSIVASLRHLIVSVMKALRSFNENRNICDKLEMEILLYLSGRRQIRDALDAAGLPEFSKDLVAVCIGVDESGVIEALTLLIDDLDGKVNWGLFQLSGEKISFLKEAFGISEDELSAVMRCDLSFEDVFERLIIERCALLDVVK